KNIQSLFSIQPRKKEYYAPVSQLRISGPKAPEPKGGSVWRHLGRIIDDFGLLSDSQFLCLQTFLFARIMNRGGSRQDPTFNQLERNLLQPRMAILHAPAIEHAQWTNYVRHCVTQGIICSGDGSVREEGMNMHEIVISNVV